MLAERVTKAQYFPQILIAGLFAVFAFHPLRAAADSPASSDENSKSYPVTERDPRLPPLLPGETVHTEGGDTMKVWSSSGSVTTQRPPAIPEVDSTKKDRVRDIDVIVDQRAKAPKPGRPPGN